MYLRRISIVHRGFSGYNSEHARYILPKVIEAEHSEKSKIKIAVSIYIVFDSIKKIKTNKKYIYVMQTIFFGSNDATDPSSIQHVSPERFEENIRFCAQQLLNIEAKVILVGPGPHDEEHPNNFARATEINEGKKNPRNTLQNLQYTKIVEKIAKELDVGFINLWVLFLESVGWKKEEGEEENKIPGKITEGSDVSDRRVEHLLNDGLHFTGEGYRVWYEGLLEVIRTKYPEFIPANMPFLYREWGDIDIEELKNM